MTGRRPGEVFGAARRAAARLAGTELRGPTVEIARILPVLHREPKAAVGPAEATRRFDLALSEALARGEG